MTLFILGVESELENCPGSHICWCLHFWVTPRSVSAYRSKRRVWRESLVWSVSEYSNSIRFITETHLGKHTGILMLHKQSRFYIMNEFALNLQTLQTKTQLYTFFRLWFRPASCTFRTTIVTVTRVELHDTFMSMEMPKKWIFHSMRQRSLCLLMLNRLQCSPFSRDAAALLNDSCRFLNLN